MGQIQAAQHRDTSFRNKTSSCFFIQAKRPESIAKLLIQSNVTHITEVLANDSSSHSIQYVQCLMSSLLVSPSGKIVWLSRCFFCGDCRAISPAESFLTDRRAAARRSTGKQVQKVTKCKGHKKSCFSSQAYWVHSKAILRILCAPLVQTKSDARTAGCFTLVD